MEEDSRDILSPLLSKPHIQKQFEYLENTVKEAQKRVDYSIAHDPDILKAIDIVERFLRKNKRICYGGQAINALLPKERQFYDTNYNIPDYDFFSPNPDVDIDNLIHELESEGYVDVKKKLGIHEGTMKVFVNFVPIADISAMNPAFFRILQKRAKINDGIYYCDPDFLKMMMYLELSRPRGEISRWKKVYERLLLLNEAYPIKDCNEEIQTVPIRHEDRKIVLKYCMKHKNVVASPEIIELYEKQESKKYFNELVKDGGPVILFSSKASSDADDLKSILSHEEGGIRITEAITPADQIFNFVSIKRNGDPVALIFQEDACHSYNILRLGGGDELRIATPDLFLHLYYGLSIFGKKEKEFFETSLECLIDKLNSLLKQIRGKPTEFTPAFGLRCSGKQKGIATLLREKVRRTQLEREKTKKVNKNNSRTHNMTRKNRR
jgi:hypothetical protein